MKLIPLTQGKFAQVDDEDYDYLMQWKWQVLKSKDTCYATTWKKRSGTDSSLMHRIILKAPKGVMVDHKDRNGLNCQRNNIRLCTNSENQKNKKARGFSKYLGVCLWACKKKHVLKSGEVKIYISKIWIAQITILGKHTYLGSFKTEDEAALAYNNSAQKWHGEFANLNIIL